MNDIFRFDSVHFGFNRWFDVQLPNISPRHRRTVLRGRRQLIYVFVVVARAEV